MPSFHHEVINELFRSRTTLAPELLETLFAIPVPSFEKAITAEANLSQIVPTEYQADLVILLEKGGAVFGIVVEVQRSDDDDKRWSLALVRSRASRPAP